MATAVSTPSSWLFQEGLRLDATYYGGPGQREVRAFLASDIEKRELRELTQGGEAGIYIPSRFKRTYVDNPEYGYPYLSGASIVQADPLSNCRYLSKKYTPNVEALLLRPKMIIITCSGIIGNTVYISDYFRGAIGSPDLLRVVPDPDQIPPGYLYAFLSSKIGRALLTQSSYGSVVSHIEAHHVYDLPIPILAPEVMAEVHDLIEEAARLRTEGNRQLAECRSQLLEAAGLPNLTPDEYEF